MRTETHVIVFPVPMQGHINPMLQFSNQLASKGLTVTFVAAATSMVKSSMVNAGSVNIETLPGNFETAEAENISSSVNRFKAFVLQGLSELIREKKKSKSPPKLLIYDSYMPWLLELAKEHGLLGATFFTQSCSVCSIIYHLHNGNLVIPIKSDTVLLAGLPLMGPSDLPLFYLTSNKGQGFMEYAVEQFSNIKEVDWVFFNTFEKLEHEVICWMRSQFPLKTVGPTIPSLNANTNQEHEIDYGFSLFKPSANSYMEWLATKAESSVVYISFGSSASLGDEQMEEVAQALKNSGHYYLWVVRNSDESKRTEETSEKGLIVNWCSQVEVLAHRSIGCFMTHCGWNSTIEGITLGVPMIAMPQWSDQPTNAKCISDVWNAGVRVKGNEKGVVPREEINACIKEVMEGERAEEIRRNVVRWKELAMVAISEGGSSDRNIGDFVSEMIRA